MVEPLAITGGAAQDDFVAAKGLGMLLVQRNRSLEDRLREPRENFVVADRVAIRGIGDKEVCIYCYFKCRLAFDALDYIDGGRRQPSRNQIQNRQ